MPDITVNGSSVKDITINGNTVQEVTVNGNVAYTATNVIDSFEDGDVSEWNNTDSNWSATTNYSYDGSYSAGGDYNVNKYVQGSISFSSSTTVKVRYYENSNGSGGAYELFDGNGNRVCAAGSHNPQHVYLDGGSVTETSNGNYEEWVTLTFDVDPSNGNVTYTFDSSSYNYSYSASLDNNATPSVIKVVKIAWDSDLANRTYSDSGYSIWSDYITTE